MPAYILVRLDDPPTEWLAIYYVPDSAKVRDKVRTPSMDMCFSDESSSLCIDVVCRYA